jgi:nicotinamidase-related amidase
MTVEDLDALSWKSGEVGLFVSDMNNAFTERGSDFDRGRQNAGIDTNYYFDRLERVVTPAIQRLAVAVRGSGGPVLWVKPLIVDDRARDWPRGSRATGSAPLVPGTHSWDLMPGLAMDPSDYEVPKQCVSAFWCGSADQILRNRGVRHVLFTGCLTNGGMMVNAVDAAMRGYQVTVIDDACAAFSQDLHDAALRAHSIYTVASSETALAMLVE